MLEIVAAEFEHHLAQAEALEFGELIDDGLRALREHCVAEAEAQRERDRVPAPARRVGGGAGAIERLRN